MLPMSLSTDCSRGRPGRSLHRSRWRLQRPSRFDAVAFLGFRDFRVKGFVGFGGLGFRVSCARVFYEAFLCQ